MSWRRRKAIVCALWVWGSGEEVRFGLSERYLNDVIIEVVVGEPCFCAKAERLDRGVKNQLQFLGNV